MKKSELRQIIREELAKLNEGKSLNTQQSCFEFFEGSGLSDSEIIVTEKDGGEITKKRGLGLRAFKSLVLPELKQALASQTPIIGMDSAEASRIAKGGVIGFKIGKDLYYAISKG
jgi:hypothetical protein